MFLHSCSFCTLLGKALHENDVESSECERKYLGLDLQAVTMSSAVENVALRSEIRSILIKSCAEHGAMSYDRNKSKVKVKGAWFFNGDHS